MTRSMQFYLGCTVDERSVIEQLSRLLGMRIFSPDHPDDQARASLSIDKMPGDFPVALMLMWADLPLKHDNVQLALELAKHYTTRVLTDLPGNHALAQDPFVWYLAEPTGELVEISQDIELSDQIGGLVLDESTRKPVDQ